MTTLSIEKKHFYCLLKLSEQCTGRRKRAVCLETFDVGDRVLLPGTWLWLQSQDGCCRLRGNAIYGHLVMKSHRVTLSAASDKTKPLTTLSLGFSAFNATG